MGVYYVFEDFGDIICTYALRMTENTIMVIFPKRIFFIDVSVLLYILYFIEVIKYFVGNRERY